MLDLAAFFVKSGKSNKRPYRFIFAMVSNLDWERWPTYDSSTEQDH